MTPEPDDRLDEPFVQFLAEYHESLSAGAEPDGAVPREWAERFEGLRRCLRRLESDRRQQEAPAAREPAGATPTQALLAAVRDQQLGRFQLLRQIGSGSHGVVYLAHDPLLRRDVALKLPRLESVLDPELRQRFLREARAAAGLSHPNIAALYEASEESGLCYLASAYYPGPTLAAWLRAREGPVPFDAAAELVATLARAVQHAHERGVLHRDLKPANILLECAPESRQTVDAGALVPRIVDFGLAKLCEGEEGRTRTGMILGSIGYMAPEQARGRTSEFGPATDVYGLGAILYELLTGQVPFPGADGFDTLRRISEDEPAPAARLRAGLPRDLEVICLRCLRKEPAERYASAGALADELERYLAGRPLLTRPPSAAARAWKWCRRRPAVAALAACTGLALAALAAAVSVHAGRQRAHDAAVADLTDRERQRAQEANEKDRLAREAEWRAAHEAYGRRFPAAAARWQAGDLSALRPLLGELRPAPGQPDPRGFAWHYLWDQAGLPTLEGRHPHAVSGLAFSADGRHLFSASYGHSARKWDAFTGRLARVETSPAAAEPFLWRTAFTPDGRHLALVTGAREVQVREATSGRLVGRRALSARLGPFDLTSRAEGLLAAYVGPPDPGRDGIGVRLWDPTTGEEHALGPPRVVGVTDLRFAPDGRTLAVAGHDAEFAMGRLDFFVELWDVRTGQLRHRRPDHRHLIYALAFSDDGRRLASGSLDLSVCVWDTGTGEWAGPRLAVGEVVRSLALSPGGARLAVGAEVRREGPSTGRVALWDVAAGRRLPAALDVGSPVAAVAFAPDGTTLAAGLGDGSVRLWRPEPPPPFTALPGPKGSEAWGLAFSPDGRTLAVGYDDEAGADRQTLALWDLATRQVRRVLSGHNSMVYGVAFSPDGRTLASSGWDRTVRLWDLESGQARHVLRGHGERVRGVAFAPDGATLASCAHDGTVCLWDAATGARLRELAPRTRVAFRVAFAPGGALLAAAIGSEVDVWEPRSGARRRTWRHPEDVGTVAFFPDGRRVAAGDASGTIRVWDVDTGGAVLTLAGHSPGKRGGVLGLALSPDGKTLASAGEDRSVRLWHVPTGAELLRLTDLPAAANGVAFSPDGTRLAAALHDGSIRLWHAPPTP